MNVYTILKRPIFLLNLQVPTVKLKCSNFLITDILNSHIHQFAIIYNCEVEISIHFTNDFKNEPATCFC